MKPKFKVDCVKPEFFSILVKGGKNIENFNKVGRDGAVSNDMSRGAWGVTRTHPTPIVINQTKFKFFCGGQEGAPKELKLK